VVNPVLADEWLEVRPKFHAVGRIEIDHLYLAAHALIFEQGIHDLQRIAENQPVRPWPLVFIGVEFVGNIEFDITEQVQRRARCLVRFQGFENGLSGMPLMHEQRQRRHRHLLALGLAGPVEERLGQAAQAGDALRQRRETLFRTLPDLRFGEDLAFSLLRRIGDQRQKPFGKGALGAFVP
jgi:hypothetical protein